MTNSLLTPPSVHHRRKSSVMFSDVILLNGGSVNTLPGSIALTDRNVCCSEKMTQTGDGHVWLIPLSKNLQASQFIKLHIVNRWEILLSRNQNCITWIKVEIWKLAWKWSCVYQLIHLFLIGIYCNIIVPLLNLTLTLFLRFKMVRSIFIIYNQIKIK